MARIERSKVRWSRITAFLGDKVQQTRLWRWTGRHATFRRVVRGGRQQLPDDAWVSCTPNKQINIASLAGPRTRAESVWHPIRSPRAISLEMSRRRRRKGLYRVARGVQGEQEEVSRCSRSRAGLFWRIHSIPKRPCYVYSSAFTGRAINGGVRINLGQSSVRPRHRAKPIPEISPGLSSGFGLSAIWCNNIAIKVLRLKSLEIRVMSY